MKFLFIIFLSIPSLVFAFTLDGEWRSSDKTISWFKHNDSYISSTKSYYADQNGSKLPGAVEFSYELIKSTLPSGGIQFLGPVRSFDSHYNCSFENGEAQITVIDDDHIRVATPILTFKIVTHTAQKEVRRRRPIYCHYRDRWQSQEYICAWEWKREYEPQSTYKECQITGKRFSIKNLKRVR